ncbi:MAG TPA: methyltransferase domain-containing protein [Solirubrobacterales bacterium]|nr:methyltransferase domain-containing protein [Solirubrobacterales bacterium]
MPGEYTIAGGLTDARRLARQAWVMAQATDAFLTRLGLAPGWACLDVGCGDGQVTIALARAVGLGGRAVGVDVDAEALGLARVAAREAGVRAEFERGDAGRPAGTEVFDLAYARLLLSHLVDPEAVVRAMRAAVRPGGTVAIEDLFLGTLRSEPPAAALERLQEIYGATVRFHGGDPTIGPRLGALLAAAGLEEVREEVVVNPMETVEEKLFLAQLVRNMRGAILEAGAATEGEIEELAAGVEEAARDPARVFYQARIHQVAARRPSGTD